MSTAVISKCTFYPKVTDWPNCLELPSRNKLPSWDCLFLILPRAQIKTHSPSFHTVRKLPGHWPSVSNNSFQDYSTFYFLNLIEWSNCGLDVKLTRVEKPTAKLWNKKILATKFVACVDMTRHFLFGIFSFGEKPSFPVLRRKSFSVPGNIFSFPPLEKKVFRRSFFFLLEVWNCPIDATVRTYSVVMWELILKS